MNRKISYGAFLAMIAAVFFYGAGCNPFQSLQQKAEDKAAEVMAEKMLESIGGENVDVDLKGDGGSVTFKDDEGGGEMMFGNEVKLPDDLEKQVVIYKGATAKSVIRNLAGETGTMVTLTTGDEVADVVAWYEKNYTDEGWTKTQTISINGSEMRGFEKDDDQVVVTVGPNEEEGGSLISINWSKNN